MRPKNYQCTDLPFVTPSARKWWVSTEKRADVSTPVFEMEPMVGMQKTTMIDLLVRKSKLRETNPEMQNLPEMLTLRKLFLYMEYITSALCYSQSGEPT